MKSQYRSKVGSKMWWPALTKITYSVVIHFSIVQSAKKKGEDCSDVFSVTKSGVCVWDL